MAAKAELDAVRVDMLLSVEIDGMILEVHASGGELAEVERVPHRIEKAASLRPARPDGETLEQASERHLELLRALPANSDKRPDTQGNPFRAASEFLLVKRCTHASWAAVSSNPSP
jgi:hypothetical protein